MAQEEIILNKPICKYCRSIMIKDKVENGYQLYKCPNKKCKSNNNRRLHNWIFIIGALILLGIFVTATTILNDQSGTVSNTLINDSGMYYNDGSTYRGVSSGTADVVVCRGTSTADDIYKSIKWASGCDVVCKSSNNNCASIIQSAINNGGNVYISQGNYFVGTYILPNNNTRVLGSGSLTIINLTGTDEIFRHGGGLHDFELGNLNLWSNYSGLTVGFEIAEVPSYNIYLHDINFGNINYDCFRFSTNADFTNSHRNDKIERIIGNNCSFITGKLDNFKLANSFFNQSSPARNTLADIGFTENNAIIKNVLIEDNTFINDLSPNPILSSSLNVTNLLITNNYFLLNNTALSFMVDSLTTYNDVLISNNQFIINGGDNLPAIQYKVRARDSNIQINHNTFRSLGTYKNQGINSKEGVKLIDGNSFFGLGNVCIFTAGDVQVSNNYFYNCAQIQGANRWLYIQPVADYNSKTMISNNKFISSGIATGPVIRFQGSANSSVIGNTYEGFTGTPYTFDDGISGLEYNFTYIDDYDYTKIPSGICNTIQDVSQGRTIHNSTASCTCTGGAWKCWGMS